MLPEPPVLRWLFASWLWLLAECRAYENTRLVRPSREDFRPAEGTANAVVADFLGQVKSHARVEWELAAVTEAADGELVAADGARLVPYAPWALRDPVVLVAQLATGLSQHVVLWTEETRRPELEALDMTVELGAVFLGFGVFLANSAAREHRGPGDVLLHWGLVTRGALGERELAYALALFAWLHEIPDDDVCCWLDPNPRSFYRAATRDLRRRGKELAALRSASLEAHVGPYR